MFWLLVPITSILGVAAFFGASVALGVSPPISVVDGHSMLPTFHAGDLVVVRSIPAKDVKVGDIVSVNVPPESRKELDLPAEIVHRVVKRQGSAPDLTFTTKGDNNPGVDAFTTHPDDIRGVVIHSVPGLGYPVLFFRSGQGRIFLAALGVAILGYFVIGAIERKQEAAELDNPRQAIAELGADLHRLQEAVTSAAAAPAYPPSVDVAEIEQLVTEQRQDRETLHELVGAIREYGEHLRSHTQAVRDMATAAQELARAAAEIQSAVGGGPRQDDPA